MLRILSFVVALSAVGFAPRAMAEAGPVFSDTGPDAAAYGAMQGYPARRGGTPTPPLYLVGTFSRYDTIYRTHPVARPASPSPLRRAAEELSLSYRWQGAQHALDDYLQRHPATGLLIARDDTILFEHYRYGRSDRDRLLSQSMAKTVTAMLVGIAVSEGAIRSIDQTAAEYIPELSGTEYGATSIRALLHMASGVAFSEQYDGADDVAKMGRALMSPGNPGPARVVAMFNTREAPAATRFHYSGAETEILGLVVANATRMSLASYLQTRIWQPMGAEADATWLIDTTGQELANCCISATLRDWARFGLLLAHDGAWNGRQIIPRQWLIDATSVEAPYLAPGAATKTLGYGYQVWLRGGGKRQFALLGIHGQAIIVDPVSHTVLVHTAVRVKPAGDPAGRELWAIWRALVGS